MKYKKIQLHTMYGNLGHPPLTSRKKLKVIIEQESRSKMKDGGYHKYIDVYTCWKSVRLDGTFHMNDLFIIYETMRKYEVEIDEENKKIDRDIIDRYYNEQEEIRKMLGVGCMEPLVDVVKRLTDELNSLKIK